MQTIYKYKIPTPTNRDGVVVEMPQGARILSLDTQVGPLPGEEEIYAWALVETEYNLVKKRFYVFGTGHEIKTEDHLLGPYLSTVHFKSLPLVLHVFGGLNTRG